MFLSRLSRSLSRSSPSVILGNYNAPSTLLPKQPIFSEEDACFSRSLGGLGLVRKYLPCREGTKKAVSEPQLESSIGNPRLVRLFSCEALKSAKDYGMNPPKEMHDTSKGGSGGDKYVWPYIILLSIAISYLLPDTSMNGKWLYYPFAFEELKNKLLVIPGLVDRIVVKDREIAHVFVNTLLVDFIDFSGKEIIRAYNEDGYQIVFTIKIENVESFEEELKKAQQALGIEPHNYVPVRYVPWWIHNPFWLKVFLSSVGTLYAVMKIAHIIARMG